MTDIELLFREYRRTQTIKYEEFLAAGWSKEKYLEYLRRCEILRSGLIFMNEFRSVIDEDNSKKNFRFLEDSKKILQNVLDSFLVWIEIEMNSKIGTFVADQYALPVLYGFSYSSYQSGIYLTAEDFRFQLERIIAMKLSNDFGQFWG